jgi:hypothetical protein
VDSGRIASRTIAALLCLAISGSGCLVGRHVVMASSQDSEPAPPKLCTSDVDKRWLVENSLPDDPRCNRKVWEVTSSFPWVSHGRLYFVGDYRVEKYSVVVAGTSPCPVCLTCTKNTRDLSTFLRRQLEGKFRAGPILETLADFFMAVAIHPGGLLATSERLEIEKRDVSEWLQGREHDPKAFERLWTGVDTTIDGTNWSIKFNAFRNDGGVSLVRVTGTDAPWGVHRIEVTELKAAGEFFWPMVP